MTGPDMTNPIYDSPPSFCRSPPSQPNYFPPPVIYWPHLLATKPLSLDSELAEATASIRDVLLTFAARTTLARSPPGLPQSTQTECTLNSLSSQTESCANHKSTSTLASKRVKTHFTQTEAAPAQTEVARLKAALDEAERNRQNLVNQLHAVAEEKRMYQKSPAGTGNDDFFLLEYQNQVTAYEEEARAMRREISQLKEQSKFLKNSTEEAQRQTELLRQDVERLETEKVELGRKIYEVERRVVVKVEPKKLSMVDLSDFSSAPDDIVTQRLAIKNRRRL